MDEHWNNHCAEIVERALNQRGWTLADSGELVRRVTADLAARFPDLATVPDRQIELATVHQYCTVLYAACSAPGERQDRAFRELWAYLLRHAQYLVHDSDAACESTQQSLVKIWRNLSQCAEPGSFLGWCIQVQHNVIRDRFRKLYQANKTPREQRYVLRKEPLVFENAEMSKDSVPEENLTNPDDDSIEQALRGPMRDALLAALQSCLENAHHAAVILGLFLKDRTFEELADELKTSPLNVQVMKSRALARLRTCAEFRQLYHDWLI